MTISTTKQHKKKNLDLLQSLCRFLNVKMLLFHTECTKSCSCCHMDVIRFDVQCIERVFTEHLLSSVPLYYLPIQWHRTKRVAKYRLITIKNRHMGSRLNFYLLRLNGSYWMHFSILCGRFRLVRNFFFFFWWKNVRRNRIHINSICLKISSISQRGKMLHFINCSFLSHSPHSLSPSNRQTGSMRLAHFADGTVRTDSCFREHSDRRTYAIAATQERRQWFSLVIHTHIITL